MPFIQGRHPCLVLAKEERSRFRGALFSLGYRIHSGPRTTREGEVQAWVADIGRDRQVHVQEVRRRDGGIDVYAHTEPAGYGLDHLISAVLDRASFSGGARALLNDLRTKGWRI